MRRYIAQFTSEDGAVGSVASFFLLTCTLLVGGAAVDIANGWRVREILQSTAEAAAHGAAVRASEPRLSESPEAVAERISRQALRVAGLEDAWQHDSVVMGRIDDGQPFDAGVLPANAVRVTLRRTEERGTPEPLRLIFPFGFSPWSLQGDAVATFRAAPSARCGDPLLSLQARVDVSEKDVFAGICLYANGTVDYGDAPIWKNEDVAGLIDALVRTATSPDSLGVDLFGLNGGAVTARHLRDAVATATRNIHAASLDDISVLSDGSFRVQCDDRGVARLGDGFVVENAAIFADCPIRFGTDVRLKASLVVSNVTSLLTDLGEVELTPDALLPGSPPCMAGDGVRILLFADLDIVSDIPAIVSPDTPVGTLIEAAVAETGGILGDVLDVTGSLLGDVSEEVSRIASDFDLLPICVGLEPMLDRNTVMLR
ncbi:hypothetical protein [Roseivivax sediminis]|uniref:Flp pilus-assembly TadE/G-like n=1 Tax=Roseivivax sediminis TaxID=936889 RepID=A0A1I1Y0L0_9RHOB|nr:hypothetical protein [Roseivivax sediminis]SFE13084.1 hypothetical protein SAMN04515678_106233 [Roseivivax sediminis]